MIHERINIISDGRVYLKTYIHGGAFVFLSDREAEPVAITLEWNNTNAIQKDPRFYNPHAGKIAKDCTPEFDIINYIGFHVPPTFMWHNLKEKNPNVALWVPMCVNWLNSLFNL
ncbi:MAG: hypothetical protein NZ841_06405 [Dictyoglomus sp.]|nr:hypothetical protein [Dictyoglomus sp.]MDW8188909.1 hypothetical protein [Dictyoglomus sp.]